MVFNLLDGIDPSDERKKAADTQTLKYLHTVSKVGGQSQWSLGIGLASPCTGLKRKVTARIASHIDI